MTFKALAKDGDSHEERSVSYFGYVLSDSDISLGDVTPQTRRLKSAWSNSEFAIALPQLSYTHASALLSLANN